MEIVIKPEKLKSFLNDVYKPYFTDYSNYYEVYYGSGGSGKSHFIARKITLKALTSKRRVLVVRKTYASIQESVYTLLLSILDKWKITSLCKVTVSPLNILLPNGSEIIFKGMDDQEKIKSLENISDVWIEECTELIENDFDQLGIRMRGTGKDQQIFLSFNPISNNNWVYKRFFTKEIPCLKLKTTYKDNKFLPQSFINKIEELKGTNPRYYRIYGEGEWGTLEGLVYTNWEIQSNVKATAKNIENHVVGADWGYNDPTAFVWCAVKDKTIFIYDEYYATKRTREESMSSVNRLIFQRYPIYADSSEPATIQLFRQHNFNIQATLKGSGSISEGISILQGCKIVIDSACVNFIREIQNYSYVKVRGTNDYSDIPIDSENHLLDAMRYAIYSSRPRENSGLDWTRRREQDNDR